MSDPASAVSSAPAAAAPASSAPVVAAAAAPAAAAPDATAVAAAAAVAAQPVAAAPAAAAPAVAAPDADAAKAASDAREYLKGIVADPETLATKTDAEVTALAQGAKALADKHGVAPEKYEAFKAPEGAALDPVVVTAFEGVAKELGLTQAKAQSLIDSLAPTIAKQNTAAINTVLAKADADWQAAAKADPEFGGDNFEANQAFTARTMEVFGTPALVKLLNDSRMGNHPEWIRLAYRVGKALSPDGKVVNGGAPVGEKSLAERLYGKP